MYLIRRGGKDRVWAALLAGCLVALLAPAVFASATDAALPPRSIPDAPWGANVRVNDDTGAAYQGHPSIAVAPNGNAWAIWRDLRSGSDYDIYSSHRPAGGAWGANRSVDDDSGTLMLAFPSIAVDHSGNAYAVWTDWRTGVPNADIYFSYRSAGSAWGANIRVNDDTAGAGQVDGSIAADPNGNAYAVWADVRNDPDGSCDLGSCYFDVYFSARPPGGSWSDNVRVNDDPPGEWQYAPSIAVDPSGNTYVVWTDYQNGGGDLYFSYRPAGGAWGGSVRVGDGAGSAEQDSSSIAVDPDGNAYVVWVQGLQNPDIYFSYRPTEGAWGGEVRVNDDAGTARQQVPSIVVDPCGNAYAVWMDERNGNKDIYFSYRPAGGSWGANVRVNDDVGMAEQENPSVAVDANGNAYAVWEDYRNGNGDIYFSYLPSQDSLALGGMVWEDADQDGLQDAGEPGVQGILATLYQNGTCRAPALATDTTDGNGNYLFTNLPACSTYCVEFSNIPAGWHITLQNQGGENADDSDADPATGQIRNIVSTAGDLSVDMGLYLVAVAAEEEFVPEPGSVILLASGLMGLAGYATLRLRKE